MTEEETVLIVEVDTVLTLNYNTDSLIAGQVKDKSIKIWAFANKILIEKELAHNDSIRTLCVLENELIATGSDDTTIKIWEKNNESSLKLVTTLTEHKDEVRVLILLKNNRSFE